MSHCEHEKVKCINSRDVDGDTRRRYKCLGCGYRYTTIEIRLDRPLEKSKNPRSAKNELLKLLEGYTKRDDNMVLSQILAAVNGIQETLNNEV